METIRPSAADTWMVCTGQPALVQHLKLSTHDSSWYAAQGTAAHELAAWCLTEDRKPVDRLGETIKVDGYEIDVDQEMVDALDKYIEVVQLEAAAGALVVEQSVDVGHLLKLPKRKGTADVVVIPDDPAAHPLTFVDLKYGQGVKVEVEDNRQLQIYAAAYMLEYSSILGPWKRVRLIIHQPRLGAPKIWEISAKELKAFAQEARAKSVEAQECTPGEKLVPGEKQCHWCPAKPYCKAFQKAVMDQVEPDQGIVDDNPILPTDPDGLGERFKHVGMVELWAKAVRAEVIQQLKAGNPVTGAKLVVGRAGARRWADDDRAEERLKAMRLRKDQMYDFKLISPTEAEKRLTERRYVSLEEEGLIERPEGSPTAVPESDKREAYVPPAMFDNIEDEDDDE